MGILESNLVSTRRIMSGFVEFIIACSRDTLLVLLVLFLFINMAFSLCLLFIFARSKQTYISWIWCKCRVRIIRDTLVVTAVWKRLED